MDFSEKYIKMCEKAKNLRKQWQPKAGDFYYDKEDKKVYALCGEQGCVLQEGFNPKNKIPLWRQDQLQEMILGVEYSEYKFEELMINFFRFVFEEDTETEEYSYKTITTVGYERTWQTKQFRTLEQLWLAFIMWKKYKKVWNDEKEEWVDER